MKSPFLDLLKQIADGVIIYEPYPRDAQGLREFQNTAYLLQEMEHLGLVRRLFVQTRRSQGEEYIDMVMVQGGLTIEGEQLLTEDGSPLTSRSRNKDHPE